MNGNTIYFTGMDIPRNEPLDIYLDWMRDNVRRSITDNAEYFLRCILYAPQSGNILLMYTTDLEVTPSDEDLPDIDFGSYQCILVKGWYDQGR